MTPDKTPTDAELEALARKHGATSYRNRADTQHPAYGFTEDGLRNLLADALAKWGPPVVAVEPFCWHWRHIKTGKRGVHYEHPAQFGMDLKHPDYEWTVLYTTPQPTQAQAGAVPLTDNELVRRSRIGAIHTEPGDKVVLRSAAYRAQMEDRFKRGWRTAEKHHGIKGGQHGTE